MLDGIAAHSWSPSIGPIGEHQPVCEGVIVWWEVISSLTTFPNSDV